MNAEKWKASSNPTLTLVLASTRFRKAGQRTTKTLEDLSKSIESEPRSPCSAQDSGNRHVETANHKVESAFWSRNSGHLPVMRIPPGTSYPKNPHLHPRRISADLVLCGRYSPRRNNGPEFFVPVVTIDKTTDLAGCVLLKNQTRRASRDVKEGRRVFR